jgi:hypothetical protein
MTKMGHNRTDTQVASVTTLTLQLELPYRQINIVMHHDETIPRLDMPLHQRRYGLTACIHIRLWFC